MWTLPYNLCSKPHCRHCVNFYDNFSWKSSWYIDAHHCSERDFNTGHLFVVNIWRYLSVLNRYFIGIHLELVHKFPTRAINEVGKNIINDGVGFRQATSHVMLPMYWKVWLSGTIDQHQKLIVVNYKTNTFSTEVTDQLTVSVFMVAQLGIFMSKGWQLFSN